MLYRLRATSLRFCEDEYKKLLEEYPCLANFDFKESPESVPTGSWIKDKDGNCTVWQEGPPETVYYPSIKINTLEELCELHKAVDKYLIFSEDTIEIYDDWRE